MGQQSSSLGPDPTLYSFPVQHFGIKYRTNSALAIWKNRQSPFQQLLQNKMAVNNESEVHTIYDNFLFRYQHRYFVSTCYLSFVKQGIKGCGEIYKGSIFFEQPIANLSQIKDIPFNDTLHMYSVAFIGFHLLYKKYGYFDVFEDMFYFNEFGQMKIWCNSQVHKLEPESYLLDSTGQESDMIIRIIHIIDQNSDKNQQVSVKHQILSRLNQNWSNINFQKLRAVWRELCRQHGWQPPDRLNCISSFTKQEIEKLLAIQNSELNKASSNASSEKIHKIGEPVNLKKFNEEINTVRVNPNFHFNPQIDKIPTQKQIILNYPQKPLSYSPVQQFHSPSKQMYYRAQLNRNIPSQAQIQYLKPVRGFTPQNIIRPQTSNPTPQKPQFTFYRPKQIVLKNNEQSPIRALNIPYSSSRRDNLSKQPPQIQKVNSNSFRCKFNEFPRSDNNKKIERVNFSPVSQSKEESTRKLQKYSNKNHYLPTSNIFKNPSHPPLPLKKYQNHHNQSKDSLYPKVTSKSLQKRFIPVNLSPKKQQYTDPKLLELLHTKHDQYQHNDWKTVTFSFSSRQEGIKNKESIGVSRSTNNINESKYRPSMDSQIWADIVQLRKQKIHTQNR